MRCPKFFFSCLVLAVSANVVFAGAIPYPNIGTVAPQVTTYASGSAGVNVFFYGSTASYTDFVRVVDVQTGYSSGDIFNNHTTPLGTEITVGAGSIAAGDQLVFYIDSPAGLFASIAADSADGVNHAYITGYSSGSLNGVAIPAGLFVGLEDVPYGSSDLNYNDDTFVFSGVTAPSVSATPEPGSLALFGTGALGIAGVVRRRLAAGAQA